jgi:UDP-glucose 4-epimerase
MRILVTGGAGFIGSNVVDAYIHAGHEVAVVDDLSSGKRANLNPRAAFYELDIASPRLAEVFAQFRPELVNHHAAQISVPLSVDNPMEDARINIMWLLNLFENCRRGKVGKVIYVSSGGVVYGEPRSLPADETYPLAPTSPYGISKCAGEMYLQFYAQQTGMNYVMFRYSNVYGPRQMPHGEAGVVSIFIQKLLAGGAPTIFGDGSCVRDYVYVGDVVRANLLALDKGERVALNIGTNRPTNVKQLYQAICEVMGVNLPALAGPPRRGDLQANYLNPARAKQVLGWEPATDLHAGVRATYEYFKVRQGQPA